MVPDERCPAPDERCLVRDGQCPVTEEKAPGGDKERFARAREAFRRREELPVWPKAHSAFLAKSATSCDETFVGKQGSCLTIEGIRSVATTPYIH